MATMTANSFDFTEEEEQIISTQRLKVRKMFKRGLYAIYFMGIMYTLRNRVQMYGAIRPIEYFEAFEANKFSPSKKTSFLVRYLLCFIYKK